MQAHPPGKPKFRHTCPRRLRLALAVWVISSALSIDRSSSGIAQAAEPAASSPEDREQVARRHFAEGDAAFKAGRYEAAMSEFEAGYATSPRPGFLLNMAHTARKLGDLRKARTLYKKYLLMDPTSKLRNDVLGVIGELDSALADEDLAEAQRKTAGEGPRSQQPAPDETSKSEHPAPLPRATEPRADAPVLVAQGSSTLPPSGDATDDGTPFYRRTWFWVTVGVVAAAGAGVAIYAAQRSAGDPYHPSGSLGALGP